MTEELKIKLTAEVKDFKQNMEDAKDSMQETQEEAEQTETRFQSFAKKMGQISPTFKKATDKWKEQQEKVGEVFGQNSKMAKLFKATGVAAVAAIGVAVAAAVVKVLEPAWRMAKETAKMYDPQAYSKSAGAVEKATKRMKTAIGSFTAPIVNAVQNAFAKIIDGITWVIEKLRIGVAYITGILKAVFQPVIDGIKGVISWIRGAINSLGNFLGIGDIFKEASDNVGDASDKMEEFAEATSAGLASFDKLTTLDFSGMGDAEEADKISDAIGKADKDGQDLIKGINDWLANLNLGKIWDDFVRGCVETKDKIVKAVSDWFSGASEWAQNLWGKFVKGCTDIKDRVVESLTRWFDGASEWSLTMWGKFVDTCEDVKDRVVTNVTDWFSGASDWASDVWDEFVKACGNIKSALESKFSEAVSGIPEIFTNVWNGIKTTFMKYVYDPISGGSGSSGAGGSSSSGGSLTSGITNAVKNVINGASNAIGNVVNTVKNAASNVVNTAKNVVSSAWSGFKGLFGLAGGGAIAPNNPQPYIIGDNTREYEVVSPVSLMKQTMMSAMKEMGVTGSQSGSPINITIELDGRKVARAIYDPLETERKRRGVRA